MLHAAVYLAKTTSELCQPCLSADVCDRSEWTLPTPARASYHGLSVDIDKRLVTVAVHDCWDVSYTSFGDVLPSQSLNSVLKTKLNKTLVITLYDKCKMPGKIMSKQLFCLNILGWGHVT